MGDVAALSVITLPDLGELVREKGAAGDPGEYSSKWRGELEKKLNETSAQGEEMTMMVVFTGDRGATWPGGFEKHPTSHPASGKTVTGSLGITQVLTHFDEKELKEQFVSKDDTIRPSPLFRLNRESVVQEVRDQVE